MVKYHLGELQKISESRVLPTRTMAMDIVFSRDSREIDSRFNKLTDRTMRMWYIS